MSFDKNLAKKIAEESQIALENIAKKYGVTIKNNGGTLGENDFTMKMKVEVVNAVKKYDPYVYQMFNLPQDIIGKTFTNRGVNFTITELNTKAPKFPVNAVDENGKGFKFTAESIRSVLKITTDYRFGGLTYKEPK